MAPHVDAHEASGFTGLFWILVKSVGFMYGIFTYIYHTFMVNVGRYSIHGAYGLLKGDIPSQKRMAKGSPEAITHLNFGKSFEQRTSMRTAKKQEMRDKMVVFW